MAKSKRRTSTRTRVTPSKRALEARDEAAAAAAEASGRYTPKKPTFRRRPIWHRIAGWVGVGLGIGVAATNDLMLMTYHVTLLPGGHNEGYLLLGLAIASGATWFLGLFDRGTTVYG